MTVGLCVLQIHLSEARSLKEKRMVLNRVRDRLRGRHNVSVAEVDHQDLWQRAALAVVTVGSEHVPVERMLNAVIEEVEGLLPGEVTGSEVHYLA